MERLSSTKISHRPGRKFPSRQHPLVPGEASIDCSADVDWIEDSDAYHLKVSSKSSTIMIIVRLEQARESKRLNGRGHDEVTIENVGDEAEKNGCACGDGQKSDGEDRSDGEEVSLGAERSRRWFVRERGSEWRAHPNHPREKTSGFGLRKLFLMTAV